MTGSALLSGGFIAITALMATLFVVATTFAKPSETGAERRQIAIKTATFTVLWIGFFTTLAANGVLDFDERIPPMFLRVGGPGILATIFIMAKTRFGERLTHLPLVVLIGFQSMRIPIELLLHQAYSEGLIHERLTYSGANFDILAGITGALLAFAIAQGVKVPRKVILTWNTLCLGLLATIVGMSIASMPPPFGRFAEGPYNTLMTDPVVVHLPMVLVLLALSGHILVFRKLLGSPETAAPFETLHASEAQ